MFLKYLLKLFLVGAATLDLYSFQIFGYSDKGNFEKWSSLVVRGTYSKSSLKILSLF
jgi:hypothetical protein